MVNSPVATPASPTLSRTDIATAAQRRALSSFAPSTSADALASTKRAKEAEIDKLIERGVIGATHYLEAEKVVSTLIRICEAIVEHPGEAKFRTIKSSSKVLKNNVLDIKGGHKLLVELGFRTAVIEFVESWTFPLGTKLNGIERLDVLKIGLKLLKEKEVETKKRAEKANQVRQTPKEEQEERRLEAVAKIDHDRQQVAERAARESAARHRHSVSPGPVNARPPVPLDDDDESDYEEWDGDGKQLLHKRG